jgi:hypothetical protein
MDDRISRDALIHDLAIVLRGVLHPGAEVGPPARLASRRLRDVLGIKDGDMTKDVEALLRSALAAPENAAGQAAKRQESHADRFAKDIAGRARWARDHGDGHPEPAWSTGEQLIVALVLGDIAYVASMGYSRAEVLERLAGDIGGSIADAEAWIERVRETL